MLTLAVHNDELKQKIYIAQVYKQVWLSYEKLLCSCPT